MWKILQRITDALDDLVEGDRPPGPAPLITGPNGLVPVRLRDKYVVDGGPVYNVGEIVGFTPPVAARLLASGVATRAQPGAVSTVHPRQDDETTYRLAARPATDEATWAAPSGDLGETMLIWPPRAAMHDRTHRR